MRNPAFTRRTIAIATALLAVACGDPTAPTNEEPDALPKLTQLGIDNHTARNIVAGFIDIYNQNVAGRSQSQYNGQTVTCPNGGTVLIQGLATKATGSNLTTADFTYTVTNCKIVKSMTTFTYSGVVTEKGSWDNATNFVSETIKSSGAVTMVGTVTYPGYEVANVNQTVSFSINRTYSTASGDIGGRSFSY